MANVKISQLASAASLTGTEEVPVVQGGATVKTTAQAIADLGGGGGGLGTVDINVTGGTAGTFSITSYLITTIPDQTGSISAPVQAFPAINISSGGGYGGGGAFTATGLEFPTLQVALDLSITSTSTLQTVSAPVLTQVNGNINFAYNTALTSVNVPNVVTSNNLYFGGTPLMTASGFDFSSLQSISGYLGIQSNDPGITGFRQSMFPALRKVGTISWGGSYQPSFEIDLPLLTDVTSGFQGSSSANLTRINLPSLVYISSNVSANYTSTLTDVVLGTVGTLKKAGGGGSNVYLYFQSCALSQTSIDGLLTLFASLDGTNGTTSANNGSMYLNGGSNAAPSSTGLAAKAVLQARGWYIQHN